MTRLGNTIVRLTLVAGCCSLAIASVHAQGAKSTAQSLQAWQRHSSQELSSNAALARYRLDNLNQRVARTRVRRYPAGFPGTTIYSAPYYAVTTHRVVPDRLAGRNTLANPHYFPVDRTQTQKPFADIRYQPNAVQRYWPLLLEAREDPQTGLVIWRLP